MSLPLHTRRAPAPRLLAAALILSLSIPGARDAAATVRGEPIKVRLRDVPASLAPGAPVALEFEFLSVDDALVDEVTLAGPGWTVRRAAGVGRFALRPGVPGVQTYEVVPGQTRDPLTLRWFAGGRSFERTLDLEAVTRAAHPRPAQRVTGVVPRVTPAGGLLRPGLPAPSPSTLRDPADLVEAVPNEPRSIQSRTIRVRGRWAYTRPDRPYELMGGDGVCVHVRDEDPYNPDDELATVIANADGTFDVSFTWDQSEGNPELYLEFELSNGWGTVEDAWLERNYRWTTGVWDGYAGSDLDAGTWIPGDGDEQAGPHILATLVRAARWCQAQESYFPGHVDVQWPGSADYYDFVWGEIHLTGGESWSEDTQAHEYGHHIHYDIADPPIPDYCNGHCEGTCVSPFGSHCLWCSEMGAIHFTEGFPQWFAWVQTSSYLALYGRAAHTSRNFEYIQTCTDVEPIHYHDPLRTEGFVAALMEDMTDFDNEDDPWSGGAQSDQMNAGTHPVFEVVRQDQPMSVSEFFDAFRARYPGYSSSLWATAANNGYALDTEAPGAVVSLVSSTHTTGVATPVAKIRMTWTPPADDWSGAKGYSIVLGVGAPAVPDETKELDAAISWTSSPRAPGSYWFTIRAVDGEGHWSASYATAGPYIVRTPEPADLAPVKPTGWDRPLVLRSAAVGATPSSAHFTSRLVGDQDSTWWSIAGKNIGETATSRDFRAGVYVDGVRPQAASFTTAAAGATVTSLNRGPLRVRGGRHSLAVEWDTFEWVAEPSETDNVHGRQYVFEPAVLLNGFLTTRAAPPGKYAGADMLTEGLQQVNVDGVRMGGGSAWNAVALRPLSDADDYECRLYFATASIDTGFDVPRATSARAAGLLDAVIVNRRTLPGSAWDVGVLNTSEGTGDYAIEYVTSQSLAWATPEVVSLDTGRMIALREIHIDASHVGMVAVWPQVIAGQGRFHVQWRSPTFTRSALDEQRTQLTLPSACCPALLVDANSVGDYGIVLYRDPKDGLDPLVVSLKVTHVPPDLRPYATSGWYATVVPRSAPDALGSSVPRPDTLYGDTTATWLNLSMANASFGTAGPVAAEVRVDGAPVLWPAWPSVAALAIEQRLSQGPVRVPGGRHTLTVRYDPANLVEELLDTNNAGGEQWVWAPSEMTLDAPVARAAPPAPFAGWTDLAADSTLRFDCDGVRTPLFASTGDAGWWGAVAAMPGPSSDVDLRLHESARGTKQGFDSTLVMSRSGPGQSELLLVDFRRTAFRRFDVGALRQGDGTEPWTVEVTGSTYGRTYPDADFGPFALGAGHIARVHEFRLAAGTHVIRLDNVSGSVDWGLSFHRADSTFQSKSSVGDSCVSWQSGPGGTEQVQVSVPTEGFCAIAVWKVANRDLGLAGTYRLHLQPRAVDVEPTPPMRTALAAAAPNPFAGTTTIAFELARELPVTLAVFDLQGARVRTLQRGVLAAGRHSRAWDGRDDDGHRAPPGLYLVRFEAGDVEATRKLARLD